MSTVPRPPCPAGINMSMPPPKLTRRWFLTGAAGALLLVAGQTPPALAAPAGGRYAAEDLYPADDLFPEG